MGNMLPFPERATNVVRSTRNYMKTQILTAVMVLGLGGLGSGCSQGWRMDYEKPAAQFLQADLASQGKAFIGKKITVKGTVAKVDLTDPASAWIHLEGGIRCNLGKFRVMVESSKMGDTVFVDGFLKRCAEGDILLEPAMLRDPTAAFAPVGRK